VQIYSVLPKILGLLAAKNIREAVVMAGDDVFCCGSSVNVLSGVCLFHRCSRAV